MGLFTEQTMERLSFGSRLLKRCSTPFETFLLSAKEEARARRQQVFLLEMVAQLVARRKQLRLVGLEVDARGGFAECLTAKWECGMRVPSAFNLMNWAEALGCRWELVPLPAAKQARRRK